MTRALVTGGLGFVGRHLVQQLLFSGTEITVLDIAAPGQAKQKVPWFDDVDYMAGSVTDLELVDDLVTDEVDEIYHLASMVGVEKYCRDPLEVIDVNVLGSRHIFQQAADHGARVLFTSTSEIYGKNRDVPWSEEDDRVLGPTYLSRWSYSTSKAVGEHMLYALEDSRDLDFTIVRYFNLYGPGQNPIFAIPAMIDRILDGEPPVVFDSGKQTRCFTYIEDAVEGTIRAARAEASIGEAVNIGNPTETTIGELADMLLTVADREDLEIVQKDGTEVYGDTYEDLDRRVPDVDKAKRLLDWRAKTPLDVGLKRTVSWFRDHRNGATPEEQAA